MSSTYIRQTALYTVPSLLLSTLHIAYASMDLRVPSDAEYDLTRQSGQILDIECEICSDVFLTKHSSKIQLLLFSAENGVGISKLQDHYASSSEYVDSGSLMDRDEVFKLFFRSEFRDYHLPDTTCTDELQDDEKDEALHGYFNKGKMLP
ncbi:hypothetical protein MMC17_000685 [Xylographa soralifera]|nr:hypothetical protein [Xylographa soralifera]